MYLQKLVIQGFKSFANKTTLEFTPGITAIVGPNGSGKSNTADAIRWVLGEQSLKTLRGKKSGDVIFAGSDKKTRLGYCQVDLHLDNQDHTAPVDYSEIVISRRIYRDGNGEYFINKNRVRLQDILMLLAKSNFGQRSYSIISQGTVDLFLSATPSQRKEYFDEAAGVRQFQIKKDQAINKLRQTKENLQQGDMLMQEIEPRLRSLTRQVGRLEKREEVTKQLKEIQHKYYAGLWHDYKKNHQQKKDDFSKIDRKRKQINNELTEIQKKMQQLALGTSRQDDFKNLQKNYDQVIEEKNKLLREQVVIKGQTEIDRTKAGDFDLVWLEKKHDQIKNDVSKSKQIKQELENTIIKLNQELADSEGEQEKLNNQFKDIESKLSVAKNKLANNKTVAIQEIAENISSIYSQQKNLLTKIETAQNIDDLQTIKAAAKIVTNELGQLNHKLVDSGAGNPHEIISLQDQITELLNSKNDYVSIINEKRVSLQVAKEKEKLNIITLSDLEDELAKIDKELDLTKSNKTPQEIATDLVDQEKELSKKIKSTEKKLAEINNQLSNFNQAEQEKKEKVFSLQNMFSSKQDELNKIVSEINNIKIELAKLETRLEDLEKEMIDELTDEERNYVYKMATPPPVNNELFPEIQKLKKTLELIGGIDPQVSQEFKETKKRFDFLSEQTEDLNKAIEDLEKVIDSLDETIKKQFSVAFESINKQFSEYFKILFNGGSASLSLVKEYKQIVFEKDEEDEEGDGNNKIDDSIEENIKKEIPQQAQVKGEKVITGIDMRATPPGKKMQGVSMLSGGERALTSIALICAIIHNNPSPFVVLDEVDAALDESNSIRFASIVKRLSKKSQFIVITHNRATMEESHTLYGVTMGDDGVSKLLSIDMQEAEQVIANN